MRRRIWRGWILCLCACLLLCGAASGTGSTPPDAVSRGAFADALYDAHVAHGGAPVVSEGSSAPFRDVGSWSPYFEALCWAKASGIAGGYAGGAFRPAAPVTRQQATVMLYRYAKTTDLPLEKGSDRDLAGYRDADTIPTWSREAVQWAVRNGYSIVREYVGHGVGAQMHESPEIPNYGHPGRGPRLLRGMTLAIEPMVNAGSAAIQQMSDGWTVKTLDGKWAAHYENSILITDGEPEILTAPAI